MAPVKKPETGDAFRTMSGIPLKSSYGPDDLASRGWTYAEKLGDAGQYLSHLGGGENAPAPLSMSGVIRELHGMNAPYLMS